MKKNQIKFYKWSPWIGCHKKSTGCLNCTGQQTFDEYCQTIKLDLGNFDLPLQRNKKGQYYIPKNSFIALEYDSDFFIQDMDFFRPYIWDIIKIRQDCYFYTTTKRPERIQQCLPKDWGQGWKNVDISCTVETQKILEQRLPIYLNLPLKYFKILASPLLEELDFSKFLKQYKINNISAGGQYAIYDTPLICNIRTCNYQWIKKIADQCKQYNVSFAFTTTGNYWINEKGQEEFLEPYGKILECKTQSYNLSTTNLLNLPKKQFFYPNKEE